jgi:hypothetical protein
MGVLQRREGEPETAVVCTRRRNVSRKPSFCDTSSLAPIRVYFTRVSLGRLLRVPAAVVADGGSVKPSPVGVVPGIP